jgi:hypothetical protein
MRIKPEAFACERSLSPAGGIAREPLNPGIWRDSTNSVRITTQVERISWGIASGREMPILAILGSFFLTGLDRTIGFVLANPLLELGSSSR